MTNRHKFWINWTQWIIANVIGFLLGSFFGGVNGLPGFWGKLLYGLSFGLTQWWVLRTAVVLPEARKNILYVWPLACALGFGLGSALGSRVAFAIADTGLALGAIYGAVVGTIIGLAQWGVWRGAGVSARLWLPLSMIGWVLGELVDFGLQFRPEGTLGLGALVGAITGIFWQTRSRQV